MKEEILGISDETVEAVEVPEWKRTAYVRTMTGAERELLEEYVAGIQENGRKATGVMTELLILTMCDAEGNRLFGPQDREQLRQKNGAALMRVFEVATRVNAITEAEVEKLAGN